MLRFDCFGKEVGLQTQKKFVYFEVAACATNSQIGVLVRFLGTTKVSIGS